VDNGEVIAIDITYGVYAANQAYYREAFIAAITKFRGEFTDSVYITNFQASSAGTTLIYFDTILQGSDYDVAAFAAGVLHMFDLTAPACAGTTPVGCPAFANLTSAFLDAGLPVAGVFYNDQVGTSAYTPSSAAPINASRVGTWQYADSNEVIALPISYYWYAYNQQYYKEAFMAGMALALGVELDAVYVNDFQRAAAGTVLIYFDIELPATSSSAIPEMFSNVTALFTPCNGAGVSPVGCPAGTSSALVASLQQYGLPICDAYYNQQSFNGPACSCGAACPGMFGQGTPLDSVMACGVLTGVSVGANVTC
jgi:hypothetical protein